MKHRLEVLAGKKKAKCSCGGWKYGSLKNDPKKALADVEKEHAKHAALWVNGIYQKPAAKPKKKPLKKKPARKRKNK
ncbi:hypothetical protein LCGC14_0914980 [marine sediment metagenome]|uniref:Uncharacterized protein n=1 Tax=marine sediment metagenome TaxID=412755 RepID=A0A0F9RZ86_9ZZZZ